MSSRAPVSCPRRSPPPPQRNFVDRLINKQNRTCTASCGERSTSPSCRRPTCCFCTSKSTPKVDTDGRQQKEEEEEKAGVSRWRWRKGRCRGFLSVSAFKVCNFLILRTYMKRRKVDTHVSHGTGLGLLSSAMYFFRCSFLFSLSLLPYLRCDDDELLYFVSESSLCILALFDDGYEAWWLLFRH